MARIGLVTHFRISSLHFGNFTVHWAGMAKMESFQHLNLAKVYEIQSAWCVQVYHPICRDDVSTWDTTCNTVFFCLDCLTRYLWWWWWWWSWWCWWSYIEPIMASSGNFCFPSKPLGPRPSLKPCMKGFWHFFVEILFGVFTPVYVTAPCYVGLFKGSYPIGIV